MYSIRLIPRAERDLESLPPTIHKRIIDELKKLAGNPRNPGTIKLTGEEGYRARVGDYRILFRIDDAGKIIYIYRVKHRKEVYR